MKPAYYDFEFIRGTTKNLVVRFDVDLSSHTATFSYINDSGVKVHVPLTVSLHQASPVIYQVSKEFTPAETRALPSRSSNINYELQVLPLCLWQQTHQHLQQVQTERHS